MMTIIIGLTLWLASIVLLLVFLAGATRLDKDSEGDGGLNE